jgi:hypothetical protein
MRPSFDAAERDSRERAGGTAKIAVSLFTAALLVGCGSLEAVAPYSPTTDPAALFMSLTLDHGAINLSTAAPYDELHLTATPRDASGSAMYGLPAPSFSSSDTTTVWVTPDGLLQARKPGSGVKVVAEVVADGNVRHADTVMVNVTSSAPPPVLDVLSLEPVGDEAVWSMFSRGSTLGWPLLLIASRGAFIFLPAVRVTALDAAGNPIPGLAIEYESLDPDIAYIDPASGVVNLIQPGEARVVARTTAYGVTAADTTLFTVTLPAVNGVGISPGLDGGPPTVTSRTVVVRPGGYVFWANQTPDSVRVTFDDPASAERIEELCTAFGGPYPAYCESGDISQFSGQDFSVFSTTRGRRFTRPGRYAYHIEPLGITGEVVVTETP